MLILKAKSWIRTNNLIGFEVKKYRRTQKALDAQYKFTAYMLDLHLFPSTSPLYPESLGVT